jgi:spore coat polysaccharide biosynthesis predicted glycosyltransferase SpsG
MGESFLQEGERPVILVDSYYVTDAYLEGLRSFGVTVLMDDLGRRAYPVDAVINYNAPAEREEYEQLYRGRETKLFIGSSFVPVREQFLDRSYQVRDKVKSVLVTTGGGDAENIAGKLLEAICDENLEYHLILGQFNPFYEEMKRKEETCKNLHLHSNVKDMAGLMEQADIAITAGGSTIYELAALGVPLICFSYAENQEPLTEYIGEKETAGFAGAYHKDPGGTLAEMRRQALALTDSEEMRRQFSEREKQLIDGLGAVRLAEALTGLIKEQLFEEGSK